MSTKETEGRTNLEALATVDSPTDNRRIVTFNGDIGKPEPTITVTLERLGVNHAKGHYIVWYHVKLWWANYSDIQRIPLDQKWDGIEAIFTAVKGAQQKYFSDATLCNVAQKLSKL